MSTSSHDDAFAFKMIPAQPNNTLHTAKPKLNPAIATSVFVICFLITLHLLLRVCRDTSYDQFELV